ncbi:TolC family protein [Hymenobacter terrenus]|uniref:TolC family protein n=1 Tax=Hymenobacter terrenus TaxID=1629124 RepID=UPI000619521B|nr:TolC family protein [Hymenobacter terrenus]
MIRKLLGGLVLVLHTSLAQAQAQPTPNSSWQTIFFDSPATALPLLTAAAVQHSAQLKGMETEKAISQQDLKIAKKSILGSLALAGTFNYGNLAGGAVPDPDSPGQFATVNSVRYSTGVSLSLPLDRIVNRNHLIKKQELFYERNESFRQERENVVRQQLIPLYQNVLLAKKLLTLRQEASVASQTNYKLAERQFRQGQLSLTAFSEANGQYTDATIAEVTARNQYDTAFMLLEEVVGTKISSLMTTRQ